MSEDLMKFNPGFKSDAQILAEFIVRKADLSLILDTIRANISAPCNQHLLVIGPRGIGKTTLVLRVAAEIRQEGSDLGHDWYPVVFSEESYPVSTPGEFWLETVFHVAEQRDDNAWRSAYEELRDEKDEARLRDRAIAKLTDLADKEGKRLLLIVENLQMLLGDQLSDDDAWVLRETLQNEPRIMLLGTATTRFWEMMDANQAFYETFKILDLKPLSTVECQQLWQAVSGQPISAQRVRPVQILTGGNPRLLAVIATFAARSSFRELMNDLTRLVDDHTDYFKSHLDDLPAMERKVFVALCDLWDPAPAREVARAARTDVNKASAQLQRLEKRGAVVAEQHGRRKLYRVAERLYNIYYLMRRRTHPSARVRALVRFMVSFYEGRELVDAMDRVAAEMLSLPLYEQAEHIAFCVEILEAVPPGDLRGRLKEAWLPAAQHVATEALEFLHPARLLVLGARTGNERSSTENFLRQLTDSMHGPFYGHLMLGYLLTLWPGRHQEAADSFVRAAEVKPDSGRPWVSLAVQLLLGGNLDGALEMVSKATRIEPSFLPGWSIHLSVLAVDQTKQDEMLRIAEQCLLAHAKSAEALVAVAEATALSTSDAALAQVESWVREGMDRWRGSPEIAGALATLCARRGNWECVLTLLPRILSETERTESRRARISSLVIQTAGAGHGQEALRCLEESPSMDALEPLAWALRLDAGEKVTVAPEIMEVAKDILAKIRENREELKKRLDEAKGE